MPPALSRYLVDFVAQEVAKGRAEVEAELVIAQQAMADLIAESERQANQIEALTTACDELHAERAEAAGRLGQMESDLAAARDDARSAEHAAEGVRTELLMLITPYVLEDASQARAITDAIRARFAPRPAWNECSNRSPTRPSPGRCARSACRWPG